MAVMSNAHTAHGHTAARAMSTSLTLCRTTARAILDAIEDMACILDANGRIVLVNKAWVKNGEEQGLYKQSWGGEDYLGVCLDRSGRPAAVGAGEVADGLRNILAGQSESVGFTYPCHNAQRQRWFHATAVRIDIGNSIGVLLRHVEVTERELWRRHVQERFAGLSRREKDVLACVVRGMTSKSIAEDLGVTIHTVENHRAAILRKTNASNLAELVQMAVLGEVVHIHIPAGVREWAIDRG